MQVTWDQTTCCHSGVCVKSLPDVFKVEDGRFVIDPTKADENEIENVVTNVRRTHWKSWIDQLIHYNHYSIIITTARGCHED